MACSMMAPIFLFISSMLMSSIAPLSANSAESSVARSAAAVNDLHVIRDRGRGACSVLGDDDVFDLVIEARKHGVHRHAALSMP